MGGNRLQPTSPTISDENDHQTRITIQTTNAHDDEIQSNVERDSNYDSDATLPLPPDHSFWQMELVIYQSDDQTT